MRKLLQRGVRAVDEFLEATEWALSRRAEIGTQLTTDDPRVWFLPVVEDVQRIDPLVVFYTFDADCVYYSTLRSPSKVGIDACECSAARRAIVKYRGDHCPRDFSLEEEG